MPRTFLIDTDTASDDAVALLMALRWPEVTVAAVTVVAGNVPVEQGVQNALYTVELCGADVPVAQGQARPLMRDPVHAQFFHGADGMGDQHYPHARRAAVATPAVDLLIETIRANPGLTLVTLGPLTNIARAITRDPDIVQRIGRCVVMGGAACTVGNVTPAAEYNVWFDPEAAGTVVHAGLPLELVGWELSRGDAALSLEEMERIRALDSPLARFALDCNRTALAAYQRQTGETGLGLADPVAMAIALDPDICIRKSDHYVEVETQSALTRGMTVVDALGVARDERNHAVWEHVTDRGHNATVCWEIETSSWKNMLFRVLS